MCWRNCNNIGTIYHIFWDCPRTRTLWEKIFDIIAQITNQQIQPNPGLAILSLDIDLLPRVYRKIVSHVLLSTRLAITRHWKAQEIPKITEIITTTNTHITYEKMFASSQGNLQVSYNQWKPWTDWYNLRKT